jgi:NAD(P)-dependent dehydrogenase (short-subunit alcohol dehydrogenase family)
VNREGTNPSAPADRDFGRGRLAVVTGAARGIGRAIAEGLGRSGSRVAAVDLNDCADTVAAIVAAGGEAAGFRADVADPGSVERLARSVHDRFGACSVLVNNAAIGGRRHFADLDEEHLRAMLTINLEGPFRLCEAFVPEMVEAGWGRVVNVGSTSIYTTTPGMSAYMASKGGLLGLTYGFANDLGNSGVTVNAVSPALTRAGMAEKSLRSGTIDEAELEQVVESQAVPRPGAPEDVVGLVCFLASDAAAMITGQFIAADGGMSRR